MGKVRPPWEHAGVTAAPEAPGGSAAPLVRPAVRGATAILLSLTILNLLNYIDRSVLSAVLAQMKKPGAILAGHSEAQLGFLSSIFLIVYMVVSPLSGVLASRMQRKRLVAAGVIIWSLATMATGLARSYHEIIWARAFIGFGEAGYAAIAPAMITDLYGPDRRARMLSVFYLAIPIGFALGYVLGGNVGAAYGWRAAFFVAGVPGLVMAFVQLALPEPPRGGGEVVTRIPLGPALGSLTRNAPFLFNMFGQALMTFALGAAAYWMPKYLEEVRKIPQAKAGNLFGISIVLAGLIGTGLGGWLGDAWLRRDKGAYFKLSGLCLCAAAPLFFAAPFMPTFHGVMLVGFLSQIFLFVSTGPLAAAIMDCSQPGIRETAMGVNILFIHLLGDAVSPTIVGWIVDTRMAAGSTLDAAWSVALASLAVPTLLGGVVLLLGVRAVRRFRLAT